jgi:hypothetical protein
MVRYSAAYSRPWSGFTASSGGVIGETGSGTIDNPQISIWFLSRNSREWTAGGNEENFLTIVKAT